MNAMNEKIAELKAHIGEKTENEEPDDKQNKSQDDKTNKGKVIYDATACPLNIVYPTVKELTDDFEFYNNVRIHQLIVCETPSNFYNIAA